MEQAGVVADVVVYSGLLDACAKAGDLVRAKEVFARTGLQYVSLHKVTCKQHQTATSRGLKIYFTPIGEIRFVGCVPIMVYNPILVGIGILVIVLDIYLPSA